MKTTPSTPPPDPDDLEWLRAIRRKLTSDFGHDQKQIGDALREREKQMGDCIVRTQARLVPAKP
ncbi:MAG: hypothetical protein KDK97_02020 [Verrucomicrobiales bacterium]|nr:hypothetical protein [Verrucomicrobiales bacterium]MCP5559639.1 hypothetical protein [Verrucomicrobiaceae bacterium]